MEVSEAEQTMKEQHQLQQTPQGWWCENCEVTWRQPPAGCCPGVKLYSYTAIPWDHLATYTQLKRQKLKPAKPVGCYFRLKGKKYIYLYKIEDAQPRRVPTERQREAIEKMRATLVSMHTCERCGWHDYSHGQGNWQTRVTTLRVSGQERRYCEDCRRYIIWSHDRHVIEQNMAVWVVESSEVPPFVMLATSTVGLSDHPAFQVVEVAAVNRDGMVVFHSLIKPDIAMPEAATKKTGITDETLKDAPSFAEVWRRLSEVLSTYDIWAYNAEFDRAALLARAKRFHLPVTNTVTSLKRWHCLMEEFATYYGMWSDQRTRYKWQSLAVACEELVVKSHGSHRAVPDAMGALGVMQALAARGGSYPVPEEQPIDYRSGEYDGGEYDEERREAGHTKS